MVEACKVCGLPLGIARGNRWLPNGVLCSSYPPHIRGNLYDLEELGRLFSLFGERVGFDISHLVIEGKRKDGKRYCDSLLRNQREGRAPRMTPQQVYQTICRFALYWGLGRVRVVDYRRSELLELAAESLYNVPMFLGDAAGTFESVEGRRGRPTWEGDGGDGVVRVEATAERSEAEERIESRLEQGIASREVGDLHHRRCPGCGAPEGVGRQFTWDIASGTIHERESGRRCILHNTNGIVAVVTLLEEELGPEVGMMMAEIVRGLARDYYRGLTGRSSIDAELMRFPLRGWGWPYRLKAKGGTYEVRVINPYCTPMVAGRVWGMLEVFGEREMELSRLEEREGILELLFS